MKATKDHISLETAKLLDNCGIESKYTCHEAIWNRGTIDEESWMVVHDTKYIGNNCRKQGKIIYPLYTWQEILWEYPEKFFGDEFNVRFNMISYIENIVNLLAIKKYYEADLYFRENCKLIN